MVDGDARWATGRHQSGCRVSGASIRFVCRAHRVHSAGNGGIVGLLACSEATLVSFFAYVLKY